VVPWPTEINPSKITFGLLSFLNAQAYELVRSKNHRSITMIKLYLVCNLCRQVKNQFNTSLPRARRRKMLWWTRI